jgi:hypothetical protein
MLITDLATTVTYIELCEKVSVMCGLERHQPITLKWIDDEGNWASHLRVEDDSVVIRVDKILSYNLLISTTCVK